MADNVCYEVNDDDKSWTPLLRQLFVSSGVWPTFFMVGLCLGSPTVFVPQMRREANSTAAVTDEEASWLSSAAIYAGLPWVFILPTAAETFGRKLPVLATYLSSLVGFILFHFSTNLVHLLIWEVFMGLCAGSQTSISLFVLTEYTSPCYRGIFLTIKSASLFWGIWIANIIGTFSHWRNISIVGILSSLYAILSTLLWPESPYWLSSKNRQKDCAESHRWLKGCNKESEEELERIRSDKVVNKTSFRQMYETFVTYKLYKAILISSMVIALYNFSGKLVCSIYAIDIIKHMTSSESTAYIGMLILDGVTVLSMYVGCVMSRYVKRRTQLFVSSFIAIASLFLLSFYLYLIRVMVLKRNNILLLGLLVIFSLAICCGPIIMSTSISGELLPLRCRNFCVCMIALVANILLATSLKCGPFVFKTFGFDGAFLFFGTCLSVLLSFTYVYLPETKDKTLQEIQEYLKSNKKRKDETNQLLALSKVVE